jgi:AcrR family transcriptional regulator
VRGVSGKVKTEKEPDGEHGDARRDRWSAHRAIRRAEFVDAALRVLAIGGPDFLMDDVAAAAGVSKPILYRYFADKNALVAALGERGTELLFARLLPILDADVVAERRIFAAVEAYFSILDEFPNLYWLLARRSAGKTSDPDPVHDDRELIAATLSRVLGDVLRDKAMDAGGAEPWAYGIVGLVQGTGEWWLRRRSMSKTNVVTYVAQLIWAAAAAMERDSR